MSCSSQASLSKRSSGQPIGLGEACHSARSYGGEENPTRTQTVKERGLLGVVCYCAMSEDSA
ncbi:MAG: hypothetical protein LBP72_05920 [Dysgonamonadaceae bacterium]|nr:hypothetical protein [Dysgonamonadaceae bacterium]